MRDRLPRSLRRGWSRVGALFFALLARPTIARATVTEPPVPPSTLGETVPKPTPSGELSLVTSRGFTAMDDTLAGLFTSRGEDIDSVAGAQTAPGTFSPGCGLTVQLVLRGGACNLALGWYNVTAGATAPPPQDQIYPLVPATFPVCPQPPMAIDPTMACCADTDFCPMATYDTTQMPQHAWSMPPYTTDGIRNDTRYLGGLIGFVLMGRSSGNGLCSQNKYSQLDLNDRSSQGQPWVGALVYRSTVDPGSYYLAFEDGTTSATSWQGQDGTSDGDFNDAVYYLEGVCDGGAGGVTGAGGQGGAAGAGGSRSAAGGFPGGGNAGSSGGAAGSGTHAAGGGGGASTGGSGGVAVVGSGGAPAVGSGGLAAVSGGGAVGGGVAPTASSGGMAGGGSGGSMGTPPAASGAHSGCSFAVDPGAGEAGLLALGLIFALGVRRTGRRRDRD